MKKETFKRILIIGLLLVVGTAFASAQPRKVKEVVTKKQVKENGQRNVDMDKVDKYIKKMSAFVEKNIPISEKGELGEYPRNFKKMKRELIEDLSLNDWEYFEVEKRIDEEIDLEAFITSKKFEKSKWLRCKVDSFAFNMILFNNKNVPKHEFIMTKIMPFIQNSHGFLQERWINTLIFTIQEIPRDDKLFTSRKRNYVSDGLVKLILDGNIKRINRVRAVIAWRKCENRESEIYKMVDYLTTKADPEIFKESGDLFWISSLIAPRLTEKYFHIIENPEKYPTEVLIGALNYFNRSSSRREKKEDIERITRYEKNLIQLYQTSIDEELKKNLQKRIENMEKSAKIRESIEKEERKIKEKEENENH